MDQGPTNNQADSGRWNQGLNTAPGASVANRIKDVPLATGSGRQITRNRASYSCHRCRSRKVKCDKVCGACHSIVVWMCMEYCGTDLYQVHPVCGNCSKTGAECVYDAAPQKEAGSRTAQVKKEHGVKRRRETSRPPLEEDVNELQSIYGHLRQAESPEHKSGSQAIEARLAKLTSMIERLSKTNQPLHPAEKQLLAQNANLETAQGDARTAPNSRPDSPRRVPDSSNDEFPIPSGHATDLVDPVGSLNLGHLSLEDGGKSR